MAFVLLSKVMIVSNNGNLSKKLCGLFALICPDTPQPWLYGQIAENITHRSGLHSRVSLHSSETQI